MVEHVADATAADGRVGLPERAKLGSKRLMSHSIQTALDDSGGLLPLKTRDNEEKVVIGFCRWFMSSPWMPKPSRSLF